MNIKEGNEFVTIRPFSNEKFRFKLEKDGLVYISIKGCWEKAYKDKAHWVKVLFDFVEGNEVAHKEAIKIAQQELWTDLDWEPLDELDDQMNRKWPTGAQRDSDSGKPKFSYLPWDCLVPVAKHFENGAKKYGRDNYRLGMPNSDIIESLGRHYYAVLMGMEDEDHLSAIVANALFLIYNRLYKKGDPIVDDWIGIGK